MQEWWDKLSATNQGFYIAAAFFSVFLIWQLIAALVGLAGGDEADADAAGAHDADAADAADHEMDHDGATDAAESMSAFRLLSVRSLLAFCTLFAWAGALYLQNGKNLTWSILLAILWGAAAMVIVSLIFHAMRKMTETGTIRLTSCMGTSGVVMLDIPANGTGEARVTVGGAVQRLKARGVGGKGIASGTPVIVQRLLGPDILEVKPDESKDSSQ